MQTYIDTYTQLPGAYLTPVYLSHRCTDAIMVLVHTLFTNLCLCVLFYVYRFECLLACLLAKRKQACRCGRQGNGSGSLVGWLAVWLVCAWVVGWVDE